MPIYMNVTDSTGKQVARGTGKGPHAGWIELHSAQLTIPRKVKEPTAKDGDAGPAPVSQVQVTKDQDQASAILFRLAVDGKIVTVTIDFLKPNSPEAPYMTVQLSDVIISDYMVSGNAEGGSRPPLESLTLDASKIEYPRKPTSCDGITCALKPQWDTAVGPGL
jgi:type VI protein secretion system component Hcp